jgi:hypothetical protein
LIIYGHRHYGHTDEIEGLGYISTRFVHIWFLPLVPFGSIFVVGEDGDGMRGVKVPLSFKSVFTVWTRTAALLGGLASLVGGVMAGVNSIDAINRVIRMAQRNKLKPEAAVDLLMEAAMGGGGICMALVCAAVFVLVGKVFRKAGPARKAELLEKLGITTEPIAPSGDDDPGDGGIPAELA